MQHEIENLISKILGIGLFSVTVIVLTGIVTDPVNSPKLFLLGMTGFGIIFIYVFTITRGISKLRNFEVLIALFVLWSTLTLFTSTSPVSQNFFGVYGRNTGYLTYLLFCFVALGATLLTRDSSYLFVIKAFLCAGFINLIYGLWASLFGDFIGWNNPYGAILGTFGNPNFISAFLGITFPVILTLIFFSSKFKVFLIFSGVVNLWLLTRADSIQGYIVAIVGVWVFGLFLLKKMRIRKFYKILYLIFGLSGATLGALGVAGLGILSNFLAQSTFALREQYWYAAIQMAKSNILFGVGMDSYGDWYRRARGAKALISPGPETVTNVAHSVPLDLLAYGGIPLFIIYISILISTSMAIVKVYRSEKFFNPVFISLTLIWIGYQLQSVISINQIGLGILGWISSGLLIGYSRVIVNDIPNKLKNKHQRMNNNAKNPAISSLGFFGLLIGGLISFPPLNADIQYATALRTKQFTSLENSIQNTLFVPITSFRLASVIPLLEQSNMPTEALKYARMGVKFNPNYDDAWEMLYFVPGVSAHEKTIARANLIRLDPLNPKWKMLK